MSTLRFFASAYIASFLLPGCVPLVAGGVATGGVVAAQERSFGNAVDDAGIHNNITHKFLQADVNDLLTGVGVEVTEGVVMLTGQVKNPESAMNAVKLSWEVEGVKEVINEIQVQNATGGGFAQDTWITAQVKSRLIAEKGVLSVNYNIETVAQTVYVFGIAQSQLELDRVLNVASRVKGVRKVVSHARLKNDPRRGANQNPDGSMPVSQY